MPRKRVSVSEKRWKEATDHYELGLTSGRALATRLGVSPATFSREMKRRGATKAIRVAETVVELNASLDRKARLLRRAAEELASKRFAALDSMIGPLVLALVQARNDDDWDRASDEIDRMARVLGVKS